MINLVFMSDRALWESLIANFWVFFTIINSTFILAGKLGTVFHSIEFEHFSRVPKCYEKDFLQNLFLHFMSLLTVEFVKISHI